MGLSLRRNSSAGVKKARDRVSSAASPSKKPLLVRKGSSTSHLPDIFDKELEDHGLITTLATEQRLRDVPQYVKYVREKMFDAIPERAGMNSTKITQLLNSQKHMPRICTRAHLHALSKSPTSMEREIAELLTAGVLRRVDVPGRGRGNQAVGDCLVLMEDWIKLVEQAPALSSDLKCMFCPFFGLSLTHINFYSPPLPSADPVLSQLSHSTLTHSHLYSTYSQRPFADSST